MTKEQVTSKAVSHLKITKAAADQFLWRFVVLRALRVSHKGWKRISSVGKSSDVLIPGYWLERPWLLCCQKAGMDSRCWWFNSGASLRKEQQLGNKYWFYYQLSANKFCNIQLVMLPRGPQMMVFLPFPPPPAGCCHQYSLICGLFFSFLRNEKAGWKVLWRAGLLKMMNCPRDRTLPEGVTIIPVLLHQLWSHFHSCLSLWEAVHHD